MVGPTDGPFNYRRLTDPFLRRNWEKLTFTYREAQRILYLLKIAKILDIRIRISSLKDSVFISDEHLQSAKDKLNLRTEIYALLKHFI